MPAHLNTRLFSIEGTTSGNGELTCNVVTPGVNAERGTLERRTPHFVPIPVKTSSEADANCS